ncbi:MAG: PGPGW domain-containing protein [Gammaproteobacteria bacterium]
MVAIVGGTLVVAGLFMLVFFGPGVLTLAAGLAILSTEFAWAVRWLAKMRRKISQVAQSQRLKARRKL